MLDCFCFSCMAVFAFSGLIPETSTWALLNMANRKERNYERRLLFPVEAKVIGTGARDFEKLGIEGEILWTTTRTDANLFDSRSDARAFFFIKADFAKKRFRAAK